MSRCFLPICITSEFRVAKKTPGFLYNVTFTRSLATSTAPRRTIATKLVDTPTSFLPFDLPTARPVKIDSKHVDQREAPLAEGSKYIGMTGGQIFHAMMVKHGVEKIFGYPGGAVSMQHKGSNATLIVLTKSQILPVFDALYESPPPQSSSMTDKLPVAEGYARATGRPGVVLVTSGPGATNLITPLQDALMDGTPIIAFCGQVPTSDLGKDSFQEADVIGIAKACTKWCVQPHTVADLPGCIDEAFRVATTCRPGPVLVDLPKDVTASTLTSSPAQYAPQVTEELLQLDPMELAARISRAAALLNNAQKPVIYAGQGIMSHAHGPMLLHRLSKLAQIPVTTTLLGLGAFDEEDPKSLHMLGMHGSCYANMAMQEADVILALGARFDDRVTRKLSGFAPKAHQAAAEERGGIIHFEIWPRNMNKVVEATELIPGDVVENLVRFVEQVHEVSSSAEVRRPWLKQIEEWKSQYPWAYEKESDNGVVKPQTVIAVLDELTRDVKGHTVIATGVGAHQMFAATHYRWRYPRSMITSGGLGTMGFGLPAAIGAKIARPGALVIDIDGDSSFGMTMAELTTAKSYGVGVKVVILNNEEQGMVTHSQQIFFNDRYACTHGANPDFVKFGDAVGVAADRVEHLRELRRKLHWLLFETGDEPALLEVKVDQKVPILPIVMPGTALHEFVAFDEKRERARRILTRERSGR
ncbi:hypothetical protein AC578_8407 [Pseudocercospora eumusae]|uniref:Acetolactate synthase n=1 Tax=Pseudocercospora eumusae TaxID=321146 RepID=A0A139HS09_9PEZI|nr:hypothetical protein AC578_8407 [Pseudocercospora eumusae]